MYWTDKCHSRHGVSLLTDPLKKAHPKPTLLYADINWFVFKRRLPPDWIVFEHHLTLNFVIGAVPHFQTTQKTMSCWFHTSHS